MEYAAVLNASSSLRVNPTKNWFSDRLGTLYSIYQPLMNKTTKKIADNNNPRSK